jgi:DNA-binding transcriptional regulator YbjK
MKHQRHQTVHTLVSALTNLPHKAFVYGALITMINIHSTHLANEIVTHMIEQLSLSLVSERNVHASKNIMRVLAVLVELGCLASGWFSQTVI